MASRKDGKGWRASISATRLRRISITAYRDVRERLRLIGGTAHCLLAFVEKEHYPIRQMDAGRTDQDAVVQLMHQNIARPNLPLVEEEFETRLI